MRVSKPDFFSDHSGLGIFQKTCDCRRCEIIQMQVRMNIHSLTSFLLVVKHSFQVTKRTGSHSLFKFHLNKMSFVSVKRFSTSLTPATYLMTGSQGATFLQQEMQILGKSILWFQRIELANMDVHKRGNLINRR